MMGSYRKFHSAYLHRFSHLACSSLSTTLYRQDSMRYVRWTPRRHKPLRSDSTGADVTEQGARFARNA